MLLEMNSLEEWLLEMNSQEEWLLEMNLLEYICVSKKMVPFPRSQMRGKPLRFNGFPLI